VVKLADRFVLENKLGSGGMARVFLGRDELLDRPVAVKLLNPIHGGTDIGERFEREGRTAARLAHPNIVQVYDAGETEFDGRETSYIVMEYVPGGDLKGFIDWKGRLPGAELARLGGEICAGLAHAHERGVIHRDIKPHNILLDENGHAKVTDFGIARALDATQATRTGAYLGTALYSSPEQLRGQKATPKSDVYSLGATLYQAATGEPPFSGGTPLEIASQHVSKPPTPPRERGADVSGDLQALILGCLAKNPDDRPTAEEARSRLHAEIPAAGATQAQPVVPLTAPTRTEQAREKSAAPPPRGQTVGTARNGRLEQRRGWPLAALALLAVLVVIGALTASSLLGGSGDQNIGSNNAGQNNAQGGGNAGPSGGDQGGGHQQGAASMVGAEQSASSRASSGNSFTAQAAEQTIEEFYRTSSEGKYDRSAQLLTEGYRRSTFPDRATFEGTFNKVKSVVFIEGPKAEISGNTATVTGETRATLTGQIQHNEGTWYLVQQDGRWKINGWDVIQLSSRSAPP
jgi:eukaryotic-like serine/threonine-protein kinase